MQGARLDIGTTGGRIALALIALALLLRILIPPGFMPAQGQGLAITLCTEAGMTPAWIDADGTVHKGKAPDGKGADHGCAFAGFGGALDLPQDFGTAPAPHVAIAATPAMPARGIAVGRGLAAPPPPPTGPPASL